MIENNILLTKEETVEFCRMVVPGSMRSPYWKYFGFPSDNYNNILTRKRIICTICNASICYNKNTTNLRTHLVARHPDIFLKINEEKKRISTDQHNTNTIVKRVKVSSSIPNSGIIVTKTLNQSNTDNIKEEDSLKTNSTTDTLRNNVYSLFDEVLQNDNETIDDNNINNNNKVDIDQQNYQNDEYHHQQQQQQQQHENNYEFEEVEVVRSHNHQTIIINVLNIIQDMLIKDLLPTYSIKGNGFINMILNLGGEYNEQKAGEIQKNIEILYNENFNKTIENIKNISTNSIETFSLGLELFENIENKTFMNIYFNHLINESDILLNNIFYKCVRLKECINFEEIFCNINMKNCSAVIINRNHDLINIYLASKGIPKIPCFEAIISDCVNKIFQLESVQHVFMKIRNFIEKHYDFTQLEIIPEIDENYIWSKFSYLKFICENISWTDDVENLTEKSKEIYNSIIPLKQMLETVLDEPLQLCSLVQPLVLKLIEQNSDVTTMSNIDSEMILEIKRTINNELSEKLLKNSFLSEASFIDPRFKIFLSVDCIQELKINLIKKFNIENDIEPVIKTENITIKNQSLVNPRKSSLKQYFNRGSLEKTTTIIKNKNTLENELIKYLNEINNVDLEQCPISWWNEIGFIYKQLKKISLKYFCVSCYCTNLFKQSINEQIDILKRRYNLKENNLNQLWFLNYNKIYN